MRPAAATLALAAAVSLPAPAVAHGVTGVVVLGPTCSGPDLDRPGCTQPWAQAPLLLHDGDGQRLVSRQASGADGRFRFELPAGRYRLSVLTDKVTRCAVLSFELPASAAGELRLDCDTGRR